MTLPGLKRAGRLRTFATLTECFGSLCQVLHITEVRFLRTKDWLTDNQRAQALSRVAPHTSIVLLNLDGTPSRRYVNGVSVPEEARSA